MECPPTNPRTMEKRTRLLFAMLGLALCVGLADASIKALEVAESTVSPPHLVARFRLEKQEGRYFRRGSAEAFTGWLADYGTNGSMRARAGVVDGRLHGLSEGWATNGTLELREYFHRGLPHGPRITWYATGQKRSEGWLVYGQQQGVYRQWTEAGTLAAEAEFKDGRPHGLSRAWHPSGCLKSEALMRHGEIVTRHFYPDGERRDATLVATATNH
jgi:hypothetical protein